MGRNIVSMVVGVLLVGMRVVHADPLPVTSGTLWEDTGGPPSFAITVGDDLFLGGFFSVELPPNSALSCSRCAVGDVVSLAFTVPESARAGGIFARIGGVEYADGVRYRMHWEFTTPDVVIGEGPYPLSLQPTSPFLFSGWLRVYSDDALTQLVYEASLRGRGVATASLYLSEDTGGFAWSDSHYEFAPVPEPGTVVLLGTGLGLCFARRLRTRGTAHART